MLLTNDYKQATKGHREAIEEFLHVDAEWGFRCAYMFVVASIRQRFTTLGPILDEWHQWFNESEEMGDTPQPPSAWGMKGQALDYLRAGTFEELSSIGSTLSLGDTVEAMDLALTLPGLGMVKAGFLCQLYGHKVGCIDSHNAEVFGIDARQFDGVTRVMATTRIRKIQEYIQLCDDLGGADYLWDHWCAYLSGIYAEAGRPSEVSRAHVELVCR